MKLKLLGPPGTGKTTRLMQLLEKELENGIDPSRIAFLTFTRAARVEALQRTGKTEKDFPYIKTIHSICYHQLNIGKDQIVRPENLRDFGRKIGVKLTGSTLDPWIEEFDRSIDAPTRDDILIQLNHCGRHRRSTLKEALYSASFEIDYKYAKWFTSSYHLWKTANGMLDYTDLLSRYIDHGRSLDIDVIFIDESQDLSILQWEAVERLGLLAKRWYIAGDDDQAIFHWAGADSHVFQDLSVDETQVLNQSYRVSKAVHRAATDIASRIRRRIPKEYSPTESDGMVSNAGYIGSLDFNHKTFILFRNHYRGTEIANILRNENIPFIGKGSPLTNPDIRLSLYAFYQLIKNGEVGVEAAKKLYKYADVDYVKNSLLELLKERKTVTVNEVFFNPPKLGQWFRILHNLPNIELLGSYIHKFGFIRTSVPKIELLSIHQSKGREAHTVVIDPEMSRAVFQGMVSNPDDEHRVWYVGVTRAKEQVFYLLPDGSFSYRF